MNLGDELSDHDGESHSADFSHCDHDTLEELESGELILQALAKFQPDTWSLHPH